MTAEKINLLILCLVTSTFVSLVASVLASIASVKRAMNKIFNDWEGLSVGYLKRLERIALEAIDQLKKR